MNAATELLDVGMEEFAARCAGLDSAALEGEAKAMEEAFNSFLPVAEAAIAFKHAGEELWVPVEVWEERWGVLEKSLALAEKASRWKEAVSIVAELKARSPVLKMYRDYTVKVCGGKDARPLGMVAWYQANIQKQAWHVWELVGKTVDGIIMRVALLEGARMAKGAQSNPTMKELCEEIKAMRMDIGREKELVEQVGKTVAEVGGRIEGKVDDALDAYRLARAEAVGRVFDALLKGHTITGEEAELLQVCRDAWGRGEQITMEEAGARLKRKRGKHWVSEHYHKLVGANTGWGFQSAAAAVKAAIPYSEGR